MNTYKNKLFAIALMILAMAFGTQSCSEEGEVYTDIVGGLSLSADKAELLVNETVTLEAKVFPEDAPDKSVVWKSDNQTVASVNDNGLVTALSAGTANITVTAAGNAGLVRTCVVSVFSSLEVILNVSDLRLAPGDTRTLSAVIAPSTVSQEVTWASSDPAVATVDDSGVMIAVAVGTATITATSVADPNSKAECTITVTDEAALIAGIWTFEDANNLTRATVGADLTAGGDPYTSIDGPNGTKAVKPGDGSFFKIAHGIAANGGGAKVNEYTLMLDVSGSAGEFSRWLSVLNTRDGNSGEGTVWIDGNGKIGYDPLGGYSAPATLTPDTWHRVVIAAKLGESLKIYVDGVLALTASQNIDVDGLMSLPLDGLHIGTDGTNYAGPSYAEVRMWNIQLSDEQILELGNSLTELGYPPAQPVGKWTFEDADNLAKATAGTDLTAGGEAYTLTDGPSGTKAVKPGNGSYYKVAHGIAANGGGAKVNEYTLMLDVRGSAGEFAGWLSVLNTRDGNSGDGTVWIDHEGKIGYASLGGYSNAGTLTPDTWHRVVIAAKLGEESLKIYVDGALAHTATQSNIVDGMMSLPLDGLHIGTDGSNYAGPSYAEVRIWDIQLSEEEISELGGAQ
jgi:hypothetical protein